MRIGKTTFQRYLNHLQKLGYIVIEIENQFIRKIWTCETWANREMISKIYPLPHFRDTPSQIRDDSNIYTHIDQKRNNTKKAKPTPPSSAIIFHTKIGDAGIPVVKSDGAEAQRATA